MIKKYKVCGKCKVKKKIDQYSMRPNGKWTNSYCKNCMVARTYDWIKKNKKKFRDYQTKYWKQKSEEK